MTQPEDLAAIEDIRRVKALYFRAMDTKQWALLEDVFTEDAVCDYRGALDDPAAPANPPDDKDVVRGREAILGYIREGLDKLVSVHQGFMPEIEILDAMSARAIWPMADYLQLPDSPLREIRGYGHYHETYRRTANGWRIETLRLTRLRVDLVPR